MAKKPESESIIDLFVNFGRELNMANVDIDKIIEHHRKNLEALEQSAKTATGGASDVFARQRDVLQQTLHEITELAETMRSADNPRDVMAKQVDFSRRSFESAVKNASEIGEVLRKSSSDSIDILRARIREAMEEMREGYSKTQAKPK